MTKIEAPKAGPPATPRTDFGKKVLSHQSYFLKDGTKVPGVTTVLSVMDKPALVNWAFKLGRETKIDKQKYTRETAEIGTLTHHLIETQLSGEEPDISDFTPAQVGRATLAYDSFNAWLKDHTLEPLASLSETREPMLEAQLVSEQYRFGGSIDCFATLDGVPTLLDFKTSSGIYDDHLFQVSAYWKLLDEAGYDVQGVRVLQIPRDGGGPQEHRLTGEQTLDAWKVFQAALVLYRAKAEFKAGAKAAK